MSPPLKPMLGDLELQQVQEIETDGEQVRSRHEVPALEGDFLQGLGRRGTRINVSGVLTGPESGEGLGGLRERFHAAEPVAFVSDIASATRVEDVVIEDLAVRELAGKPERFAYALTLREYTEPPAVTEEDPPVIPPPPPPPPGDVGTLVVEVIVEGDPGFDFSRVTVTVRGTEADETPLVRTLTGRTGNVWTEEDFPAGSYTAEAVTNEPQMSGSEEAVVRAGETTEVTIVLRPGAIAKAFIVHFRFDKAFVEPCMLRVLRQVADYAQDHSVEKLVVVGHTDLSGSDAYNQSLSERRGRSAFACLTFGRDRAAALAEWNVLRQQRPGGELPSVKDNWGTREYQYMLQDLGFYPGNVNGNHDSQTGEAVNSFRTSRGLPPGTIVDDPTWSALIEAYLDQDPLAVPESQLLRNASEGCDGGVLKWLGCGEKDPVRNTQDAWRPNRRTEHLFVRAEALPCQVPKPDTFDLPSPGVVGSAWCLGPGDPNKRCCFITRDPNEKGKWLVQPAEPGTVVVRGSIKFEDGTPFANARYVLIAPDGEFMDGEVPRSGAVRAGTPINGRTQADGSFAYPKKPKGIGVYTFELQEPHVARLEGQAPETAKGNVLCKRLDGSSDFHVIVSREGCLLLSRVHFEFDKSFVRPADKRALRAVADFMQRAPASWRLLPVGHTDLPGRVAYTNQLGVRRAKAVYGFFTGNPADPDNPVRSIWLNLFHDPLESWGATEIQFMLLDLGFYCHHLTRVIDAETNRAVRAFKNRHGLGDNSIVDDVFLERLFSEYIAHEGAQVPANRFLTPPRWLSCGEHHPIDVRGGVPFPGRSEKNRRVESLVFPRPPRPAPASVTDCSRYTDWNTPCERRWLDFIGPKRNPVDPADAEERLAFLEVANWQNAFGPGPVVLADFIDRDPDRFFVQITDLDRRGAGSVRAQMKALDRAAADIAQHGANLPTVELELREDPNDPGLFRAHDVTNDRTNPALLVADEIDNGEQNNGSAVGATPFQARGIANGSLNDPLLRADIGGHVVVEYDGSELGRISVCDPECIKTIPVNIVILRDTAGDAVTTEDDVEERVRRLQQAYMQCCIHFDVSIETAAAADIPAAVILSGVSGLSVNPGQLVDRGSLDPEERALIESDLNIRRANHPAGPRTDTVQIFYVNRIDGAAATAIAYPRVTYTDPNPGDDVFNVIVIEAESDEAFTFPHEMMHILLNSFHDASSAISTNLFFQSAQGQVDFADSTVTSKKRIPEEQCETIMNNVSGVVP